MNGVILAVYLIHGVLEGSACSVECVILCGSVQMCVA